VGLDDKTETDLSSLDEGKGNTDLENDLEKGKQ
jgi:hypothetical protein